MSAHHLCALQQCYSINEMRLAGPQALQDRKSCYGSHLKMFDAVANVQQHAV